MATIQRGTSHHTWKLLQHPCSLDDNQNMHNSHVSSNHVKGTHKYGPSLSEVDEGAHDNHTSGCMLMEVDCRGKLLVNHTSECMLSEVDWGANETHPNGHNITEADWAANDSSPNCMNGFLLSEVDWGAHDSSFFLYQVHSDHDAKPKDFFTQGLWGGLPQRTCSTPLMEYLKDSLDTGQPEDGFFIFKLIEGYRSSNSLPDPEQHESSYNLLTQWDPGKKPLQPPLFWKESTSEVTAKTKVSDRIFTTNPGLSQSFMVQEGAPNLDVSLKGYP